MGLSEEKDQPTYANIRDYVQKTHGMKVSSLYVAQMKAECGLKTQADRSGDKKQPKCPPDKARGDSGCVPSFRTHRRRRDGEIGRRFLRFKTPNPQSKCNDWWW